jgi:hypothetical protein
MGLGTTVGSREVRVDGLPGMLGQGSAATRLSDDAPGPLLPEFVPTDSRCLERGSKADPRHKGAVKDVVRCFTSCAPRAGRAV